MEMIKNRGKSMKGVANDITKRVEGAQEKNRTWWETLPMTYAAWESQDRMPKTKNDFLDIEKFFLSSNPFLKTNFSFSKFEGKSVLEVGCGSGVASCLFAKGGANVTSADITKNAIKIAKANAKLQGIKIMALQQDAEKMTFQDQSFDYLFSWGVLHHSKNTPRAFSEVARVLKKGGSGLIMVYNKNSARYYLNGLLWLLFKGKLIKGYNLETVQSFYTDGYYHRHFTPKELKQELEKVGLRMKRISITHMGTQMIPFFPRKVVDWIKRNYGWLLVIEFGKKANS